MREHLHKHKTCYTHGKSNLETVMRKSIPEKISQTQKNSETQPKQTIISQTYSYTNFNSDNTNNVFTVQYY